MIILSIIATMQFGGVFGYAGLALGTGRAYFVRATCKGGVNLLKINLLRSGPRCMMRM